MSRPLPPPNPFGGNQPPAHPRPDAARAQPAAWQPQQPPAPAPAAPRGPTPADHLKRVLDWDMNQVQVTPRERDQLVRVGVVGARLQGLLAWRRSCLILALPVLALSVILAARDASQVDTSGMTGFGKLWLWLPTIGLALVPVGALIAVRQWTEMRRTSKALVLCWIGSIVLPLFAAIVPLEFIFDLDPTDSGLTPEEFQAAVAVSRIFSALDYALTLLPIIISVPAGVLKGAVRVKTVFPAAVLPGWFLVSVAPFYSLFMIVVFVLIEQIVGNLLLVIGVGLLAFAPWLFVIHRRVYARSMSHAEAAAEMTKASRTSRWVTLAGVACIVLYAITAEVNGLRVVGFDEDEAFFSAFTVVKTGIELFSRSLVTTVVFSLIVLTMVYAEWRNNRTMTFEIREEHEAEMGELRKFAEASAAEVRV